MNSSDFEDFVTTSLKKNTMRRQYLVTHSKANMTKFSSRESFPEVPVNLFFLSGKVTVQHWACCLEEHATPRGNICVSRYRGLRGVTLFKTISVKPSNSNEIF